MLSLVLLQIGKSGLLLLALYLDISINCDIQNCHNKYLSMVGYRVGGLMRLLEYTGSLLNCQFCHANVSWSNRESQVNLSSEGWMKRSTLTAWWSVLVSVDWMPPTISRNTLGDHLSKFLNRQNWEFRFFLLLAGRPLQSWRGEAISVVRGTSSSTLVFAVIAKCTPLDSTGSHGNQWNQ